LYSIYWDILFSRAWERHNTTTTPTSPGMDPMRRLTVD
jgi:hypothetical protein